MQAVGYHLAHTTSEASHASAFRHPMPLPSPLAAIDVDLSGRVIMVTGAAGGLGKPCAVACAARGATVVLHGRVVRKLEAIYDEIVGAGHPQPTILPLDLASASADDFGNVASAIRAQLGRLDGLVHTAAFLGSLGPIEHQSLDMWQKVLRVNLAAAMALTRSTLPLLSAAPDASVIFTLDMRGEDPRAYWGAYAAAKAGLSALAATMADEWESRPNLRVNAVVPGPIRTPLRALTHPGEDRSALPLPEALVPLYLHLLGAQAKSESGARIDATAWLAGQPATLPLVLPTASGRP
jgi:NAD(P)-dependent dehydrogenase (short-subunit alcohol dehydrogenase family)